MPTDGGGTVDGRAVDTLGRMTSMRAFTRDAKGRVKRAEPVLAPAFPAWPLFLLGVVMPIDTIAGVPAIVMDVARYGLAALIVVAIARHRRYATKAPLLDWAGFLMIASGVLSVLKATVFGDGLFEAVIAFFSPAAALLLVRQHVHLRPLLLGFVTGCTWSAADILLQANGLPFLGYESEDGFRVSGFSFSSTQVAPLLAVAICVVISSWAWKEKRLVWRILLVAVLGSGLFISQGRVGVAGLLVALVVLVLALLPRRPVVVGFGMAIAGLAAYFSGVMTAFLDFVLRTNAPVIADFSSGRDRLNEVAWEAFWAGGALGVVPDVRHLLSPHMAPVTAAVNIGPFGLLATSALCLMLAYVAFFGSVPIVFRMIAAVALVTAGIEPNGFFVGFTGAVLVFLCFSATGLGPQERLRDARANDRLANP